MATEDQIRLAERVIEMYGRLGDLPSLPLYSGPDVAEPRAERGHIIQSTAANRGYSESQLVILGYDHSMEAVIATSVISGPCLGAKATWSRIQLEKEIARGLWDVVPCDSLSRYIAESLGMDGSQVLEMVRHRGIKIS